MRPVILVVAPFRNRTTEEATETDQAIALLLGAGACAIFLPYAFDRFLRDEVELERKLALESSKAFVRSIASIPRGVALVHSPLPWSQGMKLDVADWLSVRRGLRYSEQIYPFPSTYNQGRALVKALENLGCADAGVAQRPPISVPIRTLASCPDLATTDEPCGGEEGLVYPRRERDNNAHHERRRRSMSPLCSCGKAFGTQEGLIKHITGVDGGEA